ncbi:TPA: DUF4411 family protein [Burkholderia cepacia]
MAERYIIDSNVFIQGKNFHYQFAFCKGFWDWINAGYGSGIIFSINKVRAELLAAKKEDEARQWAEAMPADFFLEDVGDSTVMQEYSNIMTWASTDTHYQKAALQRFAEAHRADAFLLAYARAHGHILVTQELSQPDKRREVPIPDAATKIGNIKTMTIYELLSKHARPTFVFKQ